ncbi:Uu.00g028440.m01.CDS01 [Anthostomella pinea]|uniref:Uu.00g028440.m01.CDS01 n=1 Tax=Anthostomella pinea TaxID=933095 RepID=A0AAI8V8X9_9PEZI|nr:Uu.00g028440.m01.CDS01 [Anthostomella pinea]
MSVLPVPDAGLQLDSSANSRDFLPMQAFGLTLNDGAIEDMIKCVQRGQEVELTLGSNPSFLYGSREQKVTANPESFDYDLYLTNLDEPAPKTQRLPNPTMSIWKKPPPFPSGQLKRMEKGAKGANHASRASSSGAESDVDALASSYAKADAHRSSNAYDFADPESETELTYDRTKIVNGIPRDAKRGGKGKLLPTGRSAMASVFPNSTNRSLPSSPALNGTASPNPAFSASQQVLEKNKELRTILVHELAARDQSYEHLKDVWMGADSDLKPTVEKVASYDSSSDKWSLKKIYWKELDVWNYDYDIPEDRQAAIDNAVKQYDKQRLGTSDNVWERLLPREERGKGKVLSKLQATLAKGNITPAPRISVQKPEDGNKSEADASKSKGEPMSRSNSQPTNSKPKKPSEREAQAKRLLSNNPKKPLPKKLPNKATTKVKAVEEKGKRVLSEEFVYDSDSSEGEVTPPQSTAAAPKPKPKPKPKPVERPAEQVVEKTTERPAERIAEKAIDRPAERVAEKATEKPKEPPAPSAAPKPKPKPLVRAPVRAPRPPAKAPTPMNSSQKRGREEDDSSSSSGAPLSKRAKPKELSTKPLPETKATTHRASDASQNSRGTTGTASSNSFSVKSKNTSPTKSSPLASSPPTNASDFEDQQPRPSHRPPQNHSRQHPPQQQQRNGERERGRERDRGNTNGLTNGTSTSTSTTSSSSSSTVMANKKRKERDITGGATDSRGNSQQSTPNGLGSSNKKARVSKDVLIQARKFTRFYERYETLHHEIAALKEPPEDKLTDLLDMRERLVGMKSEISRAVASGA